MNRKGKGNIIAILVKAEEASFSVLLPNLLYPVMLTDAELGLVEDLIMQLHKGTIKVADKKVEVIWAEDE